MNRFSLAQLSRVVTIAATVLTCLVACSPALAQLETRSTTEVPYSPYAVASGDFNRDGKLDLAVAGGALSIMLGRGDGTFQKPVIIANSTLSVYIAAADFNGDGNLDLVIDGPNNAVSVYLGNGDGTFRSPIVSPVNGPPAFLAVGDFNNDKKQDILVIDPPCVSVLLGNGDGTFSPPIDNCTFPVYLQAAAAADFNDDGKLDVVAVGQTGTATELGVFLGNGDGTLQDPLTHPTNYSPFSVAAGDFNKDGKMDVAVAGGVGVFLGNGDGTFQPEVDYVVPSGFVAVGDMNADGVLDLVCAGVYELIGNGDGTFQAAQHYPVGRSFSWLLTGDFNGDHRPDVLTSDAILGEILQLNTGALLFSPSSALNFPVQLINTTSAAKTVKLTNTGSAKISLKSIKASGEFHANDNCGGSIAAGANCTINLTFHPLSGDLQKGQVTLVDSASSKPQVIEVTGVGTVLRFSPASLNLGDQKVGTTSPSQKVIVTNVGDAAVTPDLIGIGGENKDFTLQSDNCGGTLSAGQSCGARIAFNPTKTGSRTADFFVTLSSGGNPKPVALKGTGTSPPHPEYDVNPPAQAAKSGQ